MKNAFKTSYLYIPTGTEWDVFRASTEFGSEAIEKKKKQKALFKAIENNNEKRKQIRLAHVLY